MKKTFLRILPLAVAVLLATSCSKDENNDNNIVNDKQETVVVKEKTVSVSGSVNVKSGISKLSTSNGKDITFDGTEVIEFSGDDGKIHGSTTVASNGSFTVDLSYPATEELSYLNGKSLTATIGTAPTDVQVYSDFATALAAAYEISNEVTLNVSEETVTFSGNVVMNINVAFVKNEKTEAINVQVGENETVTLAAGGVAIVPTGVKVTADDKTKTSTEAGAIYTIAGVVAVTSISISGGFESSESNPYVWGSETTNNKTLTATVLPAGATNKTVKWSSNATNVTVDENTGKITITAPNTNTTTQTVTITATAQDGSGVSATYTLYLANYVQIAGAKWYTYDWNNGGTTTWSSSWKNGGIPSGAPNGSAVPTETQLKNLINAKGTTYTTFSGNNIISNNGSNAYITLTYGEYWSSTEVDGSNRVCFLRFLSGDRYVYGKNQVSPCRVRLVRAQ